VADIEPEKQYIAQWLIAVAQIVSTMLSGECTAAAVKRGSSRTFSTCSRWWGELVCQGVKQPSDATLAAAF
jgi:hypothetical protein